MSEGAYDVVVVGLGGMGGATLAHVAKRGRRVLGIERFARGHAFGASSGRSRIIRKAYFEDPAYVPLLVRAYELWRELERETGATLLDLRGLLVVGDAGGRVVRGILASADEHGLACAFLIPMTPDEVAAARTGDTVVIGAFPSMMRTPQTAPASPEGAKAQGTSLARRIRAVLAHWEALIR